MVKKTLVFYYFITVIRLNSNTSGQRAGEKEVTPVPGPSEEGRTLSGRFGTL